MSTPKHRDEFTAAGACCDWQTFRDGFLEMGFSNGARIVCTEGRRGARVVEKVRGKMG